MKGCKPETLEESWEPKNLEKYLDWELSNIKACGNDEKIKGRIFAIFSFGQELFAKGENLK